jgi:hypothetical protein
LPALPQPQQQDVVPQALLHQHLRHISRTMKPCTMYLKHIAGCGPPGSPPSAPEAQCMYYATSYHATTYNACK